MTIHAREADRRTRVRGRGIRRAMAALTAEKRRRRFRARGRVFDLLSAGRGAARQSARGCQEGAERSEQNRRPELGTASGFATIDWEFHVSTQR